MLVTAVLTTMLYIAFIVLVAVGGDGEQMASVVILFVIVFILTYGWQANKFLYASEIAPLEYRHIGAAFFSSGEWLMVFITVFAGPIGLTASGWPFWFFILSGNVAAVIFVFLLCPETSGKTLEEGQLNIRIPLYSRIVHQTDADGSELSFRQHRFCRVAAHMGPGHQSQRHGEQNWTGAN